MKDLVTYARSGPVSTIVMDDGKANVMSLAMLNALHADANDELAAVWDEFAARYDLLVGIVTGACERVFSAGNDLKIQACVKRRPNGPLVFAVICNRFDLTKSIRLTTQVSAEGIQIEIEDDGPGLLPEDRERVFGAFERGVNAATHAPGSGIGLTLVSRFAELHGGRAWAEERDGGGASFLVWLPSGGAADPQEAVFAPG